MRRTATSKYNQRRVKPKDRPKQTNESGDPVTGWRGCKIYKGTWVRHPRGKVAGQVKDVGLQQCVVTWNSGPTQAEITTQLERA